MMAYSLAEIAETYLKYTIEMIINNALQPTKENVNQLVRFPTVMSIR